MSNRVYNMIQKYLYHILVDYNGIAKTDIFIIIIPSKANPS